MDELYKLNNIIHYLPSSTLRNFAYKIVSFSAPLSMLSRDITEKKSTTAKMIETQM